MEGGRSKVRDVVLTFASNSLDPLMTMNVLGLGE